MDVDTEEAEALGCLDGESDKERKVRLKVEKYEAMIKELKALEDPDEGDLANLKHLEEQYKKMPKPCAHQAAKDRAHMTRHVCNLEQKERKIRTRLEQDIQDATDKVTKLKEKTQANLKQLEEQHQLAVKELQQKALEKEEELKKVIETKTQELEKEVADIQLQRQEAEKSIEVLKTRGEPPPPEGSTASQSTGNVMERDFKDDELLKRIKALPGVTDEAAKAMLAATQCYLGEIRVTDASGPAPVPGATAAAGSPASTGEKPATQQPEPPAVPPSPLASGNGNDGQLPPPPLSSDKAEAGLGDTNPTAAKQGRHSPY